ncbi:LacI family DNA-binding transcriptional regulator [Pseudarthrobacter sp. J75]|uniref:LacI family DNA-binding transcriptional regulator n=1 Tax=unclassified Pseudarthrobacter TaxID=2647000 RepID=UPI002E811717|nr:MULTISPECIES: LacI family DNA-binding transcriptional regulator [unclassified Pseudarthrobacter]MEE2523659.1 LacI family DNA-binding transcriptional regulator [Pseudarthrobacter sp. J47]MEE2530050.1 LacI family DNA-binding transcriptional regulator [Pseudarthrobacter sp. J75]
MENSAGPVRRPTIMEVAKAAGVSHQTVSRFLRSETGMKPATRDRVRAAVEQLNYRPNLVARSMRTRRTGRLAVLLPAVTYSPARMLSGASEAAHEAGYVLEILSLPDAGSRTERMLELAESGQVEGILALAPVDGGVVSRPPSGAAIVVSPDFDDQMRGIGALADASPVAEIMEHLAGLGHRRFLHVGGPSQFASARARREVYLSSIDRLGLESFGAVEGDWSGRSGMEVMLDLPGDRRPTAVIAANDVVAAGVVRGAIMRGWRVPEDLSVTGWDNLEAAEYLSPSMSTVDVDLERIGADAMRRLVAVIRGEVFEPSPTPLNRIIWRESVGPAS